jgi:DNA repair exonuclease SbcCD ATPase subunit
VSKIVRLESTNYKRLKAVEIAPDPDGNLVIVAGKNGQGKTSILDSITAALGGVNGKTTPKPIREGEERAEIVLETEDLIVTRRFTASGSTLTVKSPDGAVYPKGQAKLDDLLGKLSLDPLAFTQLSDRDQLKTLLALVDLPFDPTQIEGERAALFTERTEVNRDLKQLTAQIEAYDLPEDGPTEEVSVADLLDQHRAASAAISRATAAERVVVDLRGQVDALLAQLNALRSKVVQAEVEAIRLAEDAPAPEQLDFIQEQVANAEQTNTQAREWKAYNGILERKARVVEYANDLTAQIAEIDQRKADGLAAAKFPIEGLGFDESGVTYGGVPFKQASGAEQLRVSLAMAIALNPKLRVIRIADGSLLDSDNLALVEAVARENDFQVWIEMVGDAGGRGIVIEDGQVA